MKRFIVPVVALLLMSNVAFAQEVAKQPAVSRLIDSVIEILVYTIGIVLAALFGKLLLAMEKKLKVDIPDIYEIGLNKLLDKGIHYAEEQGRKVLKAKTDKLTMGDTLEAAANFVLDLAEEKKVKEMGKEKIKKLIEARLNVKRPVMEESEL